MGPNVTICNPQQSPGLKKIACHYFLFFSCSLTKSYLQSEVYVTRGINDVDEMLVPSAGGGSRGDCDASLLLLSHPVHGGASLVHLPNLVGLTRVEQDTLCTCCLRKSNMHLSSN